MGERWRRTADDRAVGASGSFAPGDLDEQRAGRIVEECYDAVLAYCRRHAPSGTDARDVAQDAFLRFAASGTYANRGTPLPYLLTIARNLCIDAARARTHDALPRDADVPDPHDDLADVELECVLATLDDQAREAIELRFDQGLGIGEIARVLGISRFSVNRLMKRALATLKRELTAGGKADETAKEAREGKPKREGAPHA